MNQAAELPPKELVSRLVIRLDPTRIYLFGSRAEGRVRTDSDFDLLVMMPDDASKERLTINHAHAAKCGLGVAADPISCTKAEFEAKKERAWQSLPGRPPARGPPV